MKFVVLNSIPSDIKSDIELRQRALVKCVHSTSIIYRSRDKPTGNLKLWLLSRQARDFVISEGQISVAGCTYRAVLPNPQKEVLRCLKCQRYGHTAKWCQSAATCGTCAGATLRSIVLQRIPLTISAQTALEILTEKTAQ